MTEGRLAPEEVRTRTFTRVVRGYRPRQVRRLLERAAKDLARLRDGPSGNGPGDPPPLTPQEIEEVRFQPAIGGYEMDEVDQFLDQLMAELERAASDPLHPSALPAPPRHAAFPTVTPGPQRGDLPRPADPAATATESFGRLDDRPTGQWMGPLSRPPAGSGTGYTDAPEAAHRAAPGDRHQGDPLPRSPMPGPADGPQPPGEPTAGAPQPHLGPADAPHPHPDPAVGAPQPRPPEDGAPAREGSPTPGSGPRAVHTPRGDHGPGADPDPGADHGPGGDHGPGADRGPQDAAAGDEAGAGVGVEAGPPAAGAGAAAARTAEPDPEAAEGPAAPGADRGDEPTGPDEGFFPPPTMPPSAAPPAPPPPARPAPAAADEGFFPPPSVPPSAAPQAPPPRPAVPPAAPAPSTGRPLTPAEVETRNFERGAPGYLPNHVDLFLARAARALAGRDGETMTRWDVLRQRFPLGPRGYATSEVDAFLVRLAAQFPDPGPAAQEEILRKLQGG